MGAPAGRPALTCHGSGHQPDDAPGNQVHAEDAECRDHDFPLAVPDPLGRPPQEVLQLGRPASGEGEGSDRHGEPDRVVQDDLEYPVRVARRTVRDRAQCGEVEEPRLVGQHPGKGRAAWGQVGELTAEP